MKLKHCWMALVVLLGGTAGIVLVGGYPVSPWHVLVAFFGAFMAGWGAHALFAK